VRLREHAWVAVDGDAHAFTAGPAESATAVVTARRGEPTDVRSGLAGLTLLKTTGSAFSGFLRDELTVLAETDDRILATEATAQWTYRPTAHQQERSPAYDDVRRAVRAALVSTFAAHDSRSVQHTLHAMGEAVLAACDDLEAVTLRLPNKHHVLVDLAPFGLPNDRAVYVATDRPFGVIEGEVRRSDAVEG
jgi:urate oxidase